MVKPLPSKTTGSNKTKMSLSAGDGMSFAVGFWLVTFFFIPPVVIIGVITLGVLNALFG